MKCAVFRQFVCIDNASGTVTVDAATAGTNQGNNSGGVPAGWTVAISADATNVALKIAVTSTTSGEVRWVATVKATHVAYP